MFQRFVRNYFTVFLNKMVRIGHFQGVWTSRYYITHVFHDFRSKHAILHANRHECFAGPFFAPEFYGA